MLELNQTESASEINDETTSVVGVVVEPKPSKSKFKKFRKMIMKKKRSKKRTYSSYIHRVLKEVHPSLSISTKSMNIMNSFVEDMLEKIAVECVTLIKKTDKKSKTVNDRVIESAAKLILPEELAKHAICEGNKAIEKFKRSKAIDKNE